MARHRQVVNQVGVERISHASIFAYELVFNAPRLWSGFLSPVTAKGTLKLEERSRFTIYSQSYFNEHLLSFCNNLLYVGLNRSTLFSSCIESYFEPMSKIIK